MPKAKTKGTKVKTRKTRSGKGTHSKRGAGMRKKRASQKRVSQGRITAEKSVTGAKVYVVTSSGMYIVPAHRAPSSSASGIVKSIGISGARYRGISGKISTLIKAGRLGGLK